MDIGCTKALVMMLGDAGQHEVLMTAERLYAAEQRLLLRVEASLVDIVLRDRWNQDNDVDAALKRAKQAARDLRYGDGLILDVDRMAGGIDRPLVLLQDRPLDAMRGIAVGILHALDLHDARTGRPGWPFGKREHVGAVAGPVTVRGLPLARLVPALREVVMHVRRGRTGYLRVDVMPLHRHDGEVQATHECRLGGLAGIHHPALLMLAEEGGCPVPADLEARTAPDQQLPLLDRAAEHAVAGPGFDVGAPDKEPDIEAPRDGAIQHVAQRAPAVGKEKVVRIEGHREPDAVTCLFDRLADSTGDRWPIDQHAYPIARPRRVGAGGRARNVGRDHRRFRRFGRFRRMGKFWVCEVWEVSEVCASYPHPASAAG